MYFKQLIIAALVIPTFPAMHHKKKSKAFDCLQLQTATPLTLQKASDSLYFSLHRR